MCWWTRMHNTSQSQTTWGHQCVHAEKNSSPNSSKEISCSTWSYKLHPRKPKEREAETRKGVWSAVQHEKTTQDISCQSQRLKKKVDSVQEVVKALEEKNYLIEEGLEMLEKTRDMPAEIMKRCVESRSKDVTSKGKYSASLWAFALTLNFYSAKAYRFVCKTFGPSITPTHLSSRNGLAPSMENKQKIDSWTWLEINLTYLCYNVFVSL